MTRHVFGDNQRQQRQADSDPAFSTVQQMQLANADKDSDATIKALKDAPQDKVNQILVAQIQQEMKDHPYSPGQMRLYVQKLTEKCKKEGLVTDLQLTVGQNGHAVIADKKADKQINVGMTDDTTKTLVNGKEVSKTVADGSQSKTTTNSDDGVHVNRRNRHTSVEVKNASSNSNADVTNSATDKSHAPGTPANGAVDGNKESSAEPNTNASDNKVARPLEKRGVNKGVDTSHAPGTPANGAVDGNNVSDNKVVRPLEKRGTGDGNNTVQDGTKGAEPTMKQQPEPLKENVEQTKSMAVAQSLLDKYYKDINSPNVARIELNEAERQFKATFEKFPPAQGSKEEHEMQQKLQELKNQQDYMKNLQQADRQQAVVAELPPPGIPPMVPPGASPLEMRPAAPDRFHDARFQQMIQAESNGNMAMQSNPRMAAAEYQRALMLSQQYMHDNWSYMTRQEQHMDADHHQQLMDKCRISTLPRQEIVPMIPPPPIFPVPPMVPPMPGVRMQMGPGILEIPNPFRLYQQ